MNGLRETNEQSMLQAHKAGRTYYRSNRPETVDLTTLRTLANSCGWHADDEDAWVAGYMGERKRLNQPK